MGALTHSEREALISVDQRAGERAQQYLTFSVGAEIFALTIAGIKEIIEYRPPTEVPMMPLFMRGVINLRGRVVPVIDLAARFGRDAAGLTRRSCIVILEVGEQDMQHDIGVLVDSVSAVVEIADSQIEPAPSFGAGLRPDFIGGMGRLEDHFVIILETGKVLSIDELSLLGEPDGGEQRPDRPGAAPQLEAAINGRKGE